MRPEEGTEVDKICTISLMLYGKCSVCSIKLNPHNIQVAHWVRLKLIHTFEDAFWKCKIIFDKFVTNWINFLRCNMRCFQKFTIAVESWFRILYAQLNEEKWRKLHLHLCPSCLLQGYYFNDKDENISKMRGPLSPNTPVYRTKIFRSCV